MSDHFRYNQKIYYVPKLDERLARHIPITQLRLSNVPPLLVLGHHIRISPKLRTSGKIAETGAGTFWLSKEAYEVYKARSARFLRGLLDWFGPRNGRP